MNIEVQKHLDVNDSKYYLNEDNDFLVTYWEKIL